MKSLAAICVVASVWAAAAAAQTTKDDIIWNDPPKAAAPPAAPPGGSAPIRDDFAKDKAGAADGTRKTPTAAQGAWAEPSMTSKGKVEKSNTSATAGPCREFQQDIVIDGRKEKAHGRACRQPDGSWKIGN
jgi:hypothetical protein